ncbi:MAG TPA: GNAT family N-acetyltransferase [Ilumatobacteraceae bacterium]|nr:GNAT family N-acetyltransferase [Ilumatobacteraceae bacterium]
MAITFEPADARTDHAVLTELNVAYFDWLDANIQQTFGLDLPALLGQPIVEYVAATLDKLCAAEPPEGVFYVVRRDGSAVGMGGVRRTNDGASEMKRVFVRPDQRGSGLGTTIVRRLISDATSFGYSSMRLDSGPFMTSAHRVYEADGFRDRPIYDGSEVPTELHHNWRFMERSLQ